MWLFCCYCIKFHKITKSFIFILNEMKSVILMFTLQTFGETCRQKSKFVNSIVMLEAHLTKKSLPNQFLLANVTSSCKQLKPNAKSA